MILLAAIAFYCQRSTSEAPQRLAESHGGLQRLRFEYWTATIRARRNHWPDERRRSVQVKLCLALRGSDAFNSQCYMFFNSSTTW